MHLKRKAWEDLRGPLQARLHTLQMAAIEAGLPVIILLEGWDAAGKGASIRVLSEAFDPGGFKTWPIRAPRGEDTLYPWLRRFWMKLPARGQIAIFDQGWYSQAWGLAEEDRRRALRDIGDLEDALAHDGYVLIKFWLSISQDVQRHRLKLREKRTSGGRLAKSWAQNRTYEACAQAAAEMLEKTSYTWAPWVSIEAQDPHYVWWRMCEVVAERLSDGLRARGVIPATPGEDERIARARALLGAFEETPRVSIP